MSISINLINSEITRCKSIRFALISLFVDASSLGNLSMITRYGTDAATLYYFEKCLEDAIKFERTQTYINDVIYKIREYINVYNVQSSVDYFTSKYANLVCPTVINIPGTIVNPEASIVNNITNNLTIISGGIVEDLSQSLTVSTLGQTEIEVPFDINTIDKDSVNLTINGDDPVYTLTGEGYHIEDTTLIWHNTAYRLRPDMQIVIKWRK